jgi:hypothetical protein
MQIILQISKKKIIIHKKNNDIDQRRKVNMENKKRTFLNEEKRNELTKDILAGNYNIDELCKKYNISRCTLWRRVREIKDNPKNINVDNFNDMADSSYLDIDNAANKSKLIPYYRDRTIKVGLIKDRHPMPCTEFIFDKAIDSDHMFNYSYLDSHISEFLLNKVCVRSIDNEYHAEKDLCVYVTGLQCVLGSLIKMCSIYNISLTLMHYNRDTNVYEHQVIFEKKFGSSKDYFKNITGKIYFTDNCPDIDTVKNSKYIFILKEIRNKKDSYDNLEFINNMSFLYKDEDRAWNEYLMLCKNASSSNEYISIYLECGRLNFDNDYNKIRVMCRNYNFESKNVNLPTVERSNDIHKIFVKKEDLYL